MTSISVEILQTLFEHRDFDVNAKDVSGSTILHKAVSAKVDDVVEVLLDHAADANCTRRSDGKTSLMIAIQGEDTKVMEKLLKQT